MSNEEILNSLEEEVKQAKTNNELNEIRIKYLSKKGTISLLTSKIATLPVEERKELKNKATLIIEEKKNKIDTEELNKKLESESIDITLPSTKIPVGAPNILEKIVEEIEDVLMSMGYDVVDGPEIEEDKYNFELLNIPKGHPARDAQDTFYIKDEEILLRSQTSPVQARVMEKQEPPIKMISPGKVFRSDAVDATHSPIFYQMEGLVIDKGITFADLKGTLELFAKKMFGDKVKTKFRPHHFPFTEPSAEMDATCFVCNGKGCRVCKGEGWIEILGCGMVHPDVLRNCGIDPEVYSGFAFGFGVDRMVMLKYGIDDIRLLYESDMRFLNQF